MKVPRFKIISAWMKYTSDCFVGNFDEQHIVYFEFGIENWYELQIYKSEYVLI